MGTIKLTLLFQAAELEEFVESFLVPIIEVLKSRELGTRDPGNQVEELRLITRRGINNQVKQMINLLLHLFLPKAQQSEIDFFLATKSRCGSGSSRRPTTRRPSA